MIYCLFLAPPWFSWVFHWAVDVNAKPIQGQQHFCDSFNLRKHWKFIRMSSQSRKLLWDSVSNKGKGIVRNGSQFYCAFSSALGNAAFVFFFVFLSQTLSWAEVLWDFLILQFYHKLHCYLVLSVMLQLLQSLDFSTWEPGLHEETKTKLHPLQWWSAVKKH